MPFLRVESGWFVVDTGLQHSFSPSGCPLNGDTCGLDLDTPGLPVRVPGIRPQEVFDCVEEQVGVRPTGFLGQDVLGALGCFCLDYDQKVLDVGPDPFLDWDVSIPMENPGWPLTVQGGLVVDTGAAFAVTLDPPHCPGGPLRIHTFPAPLDVQLAANAPGLLGPGLAMYNPALSASLHQLGTRGVVGAETLARGRAWFDFRQGVLRLKDLGVRSYPLLALTESTRWPGFQVSLRDGQVRVATVHAGGAQPGQSLEVGPPPPGVELVDHVMGQLLTTAPTVSVSLDGQAQELPTFPLFPGSVGKP
jgi:hypothetical protein